MDRQPKFKYGDVVINIETGKRTTIKKPLRELVNVIRNGKITRKEEFTGEYYCFWHNDEETIYGNVSEELLESTPSTS
jgi:hypothetical protein